MNKHANKLVVFLLSMSVLTACSSATALQANTSSTTAAATTESSSTPVDDTITKISQIVKVEDNDSYTDFNTDSANQIQLNGNTASVQGSGAEAKEGSVTIQKAGTYVVSGSLADGQIVVDVPDKGVVRLVLNGVNIQNSDSSPIYVKQAGKTIISLPEGTENIISDGKTYAKSDASTDVPNAAIYSDNDLTFNGTGKLIVRGNYNNGITSKDDLKIMGGTYEVHAIDDAIMGRDLVAVKDGTITVEAGGDGIKTTYDTDTEKGYVALEAGTYTITSGSDGIQASQSVLIDGGTYTIVSGGGSQNGEVKRTDDRGRPGEMAAAPSTAESSETDTKSAKGIKAAGNLIVNNGTFQIDSADDSVHSNHGITINGGQFAIISGDDGIHADTAITVAGGTIDISKSYEGIESANITLANGEIHVTASDDGINVGGGNDGSSINGRPGQNQFSTADSGNRKLTITGGHITVDSEGDGLDANGSIAMSGGTVIVSGPTSNGNGALDYDSTFQMSGGTLIAAGSAGMAQGPSEESAQNAIVMTYPETQKAGTLVHLQDSTGKTIATFAPAKDYETVVISLPELKKDATYTLYSGGAANGSPVDGLYDGGTYEGGTKVVEFTTSSNVTWVNESGVTTARSGHGGPPNGRPFPGK
ncbi:carbohydrate-binding domain-containing protein [Brevibacillus migulae]|uniref:carbohydrate-binding domain-containing protein n=1 Tax=Brevibacillus migulae TaxID=1644114 RepID=UPI00106E0DBC|nr:carbohydrate-binding domain-containing protein [Brevibacillus migulae]